MEQWCSPSAAALQGTIRLTRTVKPGAYVSTTNDIAAVSLMVMNRDRCRLAPRSPLTAYGFPSAVGLSLTVRASVWRTGRASWRALARR